MKAMLLAAGLGTRLRPLTDDRPKCMVSVAGRPMLIRDIEWLRDNGIEDIVVNLHHHPDAVVAAVGDGSALGVRIAYSRENELLGTAGGVLAARHLLGDGPFILAYADNLFELDLERVLREHRQSGAMATMTLLYREDVSSSGVAVLDGEGWIVDFQEKPAPGTEASHWVNAGLLVCESGLLDELPQQIPSDLSRDVMSPLSHRYHALRGHQIERGERVMWIDTLDDLRRTEDALSRSQTAGQR